MATFRNLLIILSLGVLMSATAGCTFEEEPIDIENVEQLSGEEQAILFSLPLDCDPATLPPLKAWLCKVKRFLAGRRLFDREQFGGNGRTCLTCHSRQTGTISPADVQARLAYDPNDPLFVHDGLDDGFSGTSRIEAHATIRVTLPLPPHITIAGDPTATHVTVNRGVPTTKDTPALDPALMYDLRNITLEDQALGAVHAHAQNTVEPTALQLELIAEFQEKAPRFFSSFDTFRFARGGPPPELPPGNTAEEQRGRLFFIDAPFNPPAKEGICALCHSGPMLNEISVFGAQALGAPPGSRFANVGVSEFNTINNPVYTFLIDDGIGNVIPVTSPDLGVIMTPPGNPLINLPPPFVVHPAFFANFFKTPTLWNSKNTAPYFHDSSSKTIEEMVDHYVRVFTEGLATPSGIQVVPLDQQDADDMVAYMLLL